MRQYIHQYIDYKELDKWLNTIKIKETQSILIQLFSSILDITYVQNITSYILKKIPSSIIIGATTEGGILNDEIIDNSLIISISIFDKTKLNSIHLDGNDYENIANKISKNIIKNDTKCMIMFTDGINFNANIILKYLEKSSKNKIIIAGGIAGGNKKISKTYCIHNNYVFENGIVIVSLSNQNLKIFTESTLSWKPIGKDMAITKSNENIIYEIDNQSIKNIYTKYLGNDIIKNMSTSSLEFPLMGKDLNLKTTKAMFYTTKDNKGIIYGGNKFCTKEKIRFGIKSPKMFIQNTEKIYNNAIKHPIEGMFVYLSITHKMFSNDMLEKKFTTLSKIAPLSGFFTYGEFSHIRDKNILLNLTTSVLGLSENDKIKKHLKDKKIIHKDFAIDALSHLINVTLEEKKIDKDQLFKINKSLNLKNKALNVSANAIVITDIKGNILWANNAYTELTGYAISDYLGKNPKNIVNSNMHNNGFFKNLWDTILSNRVWHGEINNKHKSGAIYREEMTITPMSNEYGVIEHFVAVKQDITKRKIMEAEIEKFAFYDHLTGLANRKLLFDRLLNLQSISQTSHKYFAILFLDLDNFKPLNDNYGHVVGDLLLKEVADRLVDCVRKVDTVSRFGGDEFVILLSNLSKDKNKSKEIALNITQKTKDIISKPYLLSFKVNDEKSSITHKCTLSVGVSTFLSHELSCEEMIIKADTAMYLAKKMGKDNIKYLD